jgi:hypothetical protein
MLRKARKQKPKLKKPKPRAERKPSALGAWWAALSPQGQKKVGRVFLGASLAIALAAGIAVGCKALERHVMSEKATPPPSQVRVVFVGSPEWVQASLLRQVVSEITPPSAAFDDATLTQQVYDLASANPWIREVRSVVKRRTDDPRVGVIEVQANFRSPLARVKIAEEYLYVDGEGWTLPQAHVPQWIAFFPADKNGRARYACYVRREDAPAGVRVEAIPYITIEGVAVEPPAIGKQWKSDDLADGLKLVRLIGGRPYARQIATIDVRNFAGRVSRAEPHLRMYAQAEGGAVTDIRFGRFSVPGGDYIIPPERKIQYLEDYAKSHNGQLAGFNSYIDLRYDELRISMN